MPKRTFLPFGEWLPDQKLFLNQGLLRAENVVPVYGNYFSAPTPNLIGGVGDPLPQAAWGLGTLATSPSTWSAFIPTTSKIYEVTSGGVRTDRSGAAYASPDTFSGGQIVAFGQSVIETRYTAPPNILLPGAATFAPLHSGTFAPAGRFPFVIRGNLFLAHCSVPAPYDAVPAGANPQLVAWSQTDAPRFFGGPRVDPQYVGADYQQVQNDYGQITGAVGGNYALLFQQRAVVRIDGPPYTFQEIIRGKGCRFPNSIVQDDQNTYFWGEGGPSVIEYGGQLLKSDQVTVLGSGKVVRTMIDDTTNFSAGISLKHSANPHTAVSAHLDTQNRLIFWAVDNTGTGLNLLLVYNIDEKRFTIFYPQGLGGGAPGALFLTTRGETGDGWAPGRNGAFIQRVIGGTDPGDHLMTWQVPTAPANLPDGTVAPPVIATGYVQLNPDSTTRILRARPIISGIMPPSLTLTLTDTSDPFQPQVGGTAGFRDTSGWYVFQNSFFCDFHALAITCTNAGNGVNEWKGFEVEFETGAAYGT